MSTRFVWKGLHLLNITFFPFFLPYREKVNLCVLYIVFLWGGVCVFCCMHRKYKMRERETTVKIMLLIFTRNCIDYDYVYLLSRNCSVSEPRKVVGSEKKCCVDIVCVQRTRGKHIGNSFLCNNHFCCLYTD